MSEQPVLECRNLGRTYRDGELEVEVLRDINFSLPRAAKVAIVGASGSGKSTLLNLLGGLERHHAAADRHARGVVEGQQADAAREGVPVGDAEPGLEDHERATAVDR